MRPEDVQITAHGDTLTIRGEIKAEEEKKDEHYHLRERRYGQFLRTVSLSTPISADKAQAVPRIALDGAHAGPPGLLSGRGSGSRSGHVRCH